MIDPRDYAEAIARAVPANITAVAIHDEKSLPPTLYEVWINGKLKLRVPKAEAIAFLDGIVAGTNIWRQ